MLRMSDPPVRINSSIGSTEYRRRGQNSLSFQASSQMVRARRWSAREYRLLALGGSKIALFVEDVVERQKPFGLDELHRAVAQQRSRVHHLFTRSGRSGGDVAADDGQRAAGGRGGGNLSNGLRGSRHERRFVQKIGGRIATNRQLREHDDVCLGRRGLPRELDNFLCIPLKIPNRGVDLSESDLHFFSLATSRVVCSSQRWQKHLSTAERGHGPSVVSYLS